MYKQQIHKYTLVCVYILCVNIKIIENGEDMECMEVSFRILNFSPNIHKSLYCKGQIFRNANRSRNIFMMGRTRKQD